MKTKSVISTLVLTSLLVFGFQNCGGSEFSTDEELNVEQTSFNEDQLLEILDEVDKKAAALGEVTSETRQPEAVRLRTKLMNSKEKILQMIAGELSIGSPQILTEVDFLVYLLSEAGDELIMDDLDSLKEEVAANRLAIANLGAEFGEFKDVVNSRLDQVDALIAALQQRDVELQAAIDQLRTDTELENLVLKNAIEALKVHMNTEVAKLYAMNEQLTADILAQKDVLDDLFKSQEDLANLSGRMCTLGTDGMVNDSRTMCDGTDLSDGATCCISVEAVDCSTLFPSTEAVSARNQCEIVIASIKSHDAQLQAIREVDERQSELISGLLDDVTSLNEQAKILADGQVLLASSLLELNDKINSIDARLLIVEFKAARAEAAASISERVNLTRAWVLQRQKDVGSRFCHANFNQARKMFDYEAQRHNRQFCHYKMAQLKQAMISLQNISAMTDGIESLNVDANCSATVAGKSAESLSIAELTTPATFTELNEKCDAGQSLVKAKLLNAVKALNTIAPDFRTLGYMAKKAKIAQMIFLGSSLADASNADKEYFIDIDPGSVKNKKTVFGLTEAMFKNKYVSHILRDSAGRFPADIEKISSARIPDSTAVYSASEIMAASSSDTAALKLYQLGSNASWDVLSRTNAGGVVTGRLSASHLMEYPKDIEGGLCPVQNDVVVLKGKNDDKYYAYTINYDRAGNEIVRGLKWGGSHVEVASSTANFNSGLTRQGRFWHSRNIYKNGIPNMDLRGRFVLNVTRPYSRVYTGKGHCLHFTAAAPLKDKEWVAKDSSTNLLYRYLSGYDASEGSYLDTQCKNNMGSKSVVRSVALTAEENGRMAIADSEGLSGATFSKRDQITSENTQLGSNYWVTKRKALNYGSGEHPSEDISAGTPFFSPGSTSVMAVKAWRKATASDAITKQECTPSE